MGTEETREQLQMYNYFRSCIYIFLIIELVMNLPVTSESVPSCKFIELVCIFITCIGTRAKKSLRFNIRTMVIYPIIVGFSLIIICIVLQHGLWGGELCGFSTNRVLYALSSIVGTMLIHQGGDGIARYYNYKLGTERQRIFREYPDGVLSEQKDAQGLDQYHQSLPWYYRLRYAWIW